ncbi:CapA family protein [Streptomyces lomondensis]|uniref:Polyglutamine synthesis accessory protein n=1 Tax=Streptomyces lomondensis TaxID=68229 RepID=A0ABQ2X3R2_9ACTN|nr:CapA family protein [Streptomyces lomondensis]MCF0079828.1 CapA family protein [Streptomyces lomondensis]GGW98007.1 putative polyglutamine synthesis accessory protein [Streptomyces lomondensis]
MGDGVVTLFLCGDVMLGRGVDQILAHPGDPALREAYVEDARSYVRLAEAAHGPVPAPVPPSWPWGEALRVLDEAAPDARIVNLETSVTRGGTFAPDKEVHYRLHPAGLTALSVARPDVTVLANNHVLDFGRPGLLETLDTLGRAGLRTAGAGRDAEQAYAPTTVPLPGGRRLLVFALGARSSGIPSSWAATADRPGVAYLPDLSPAAADTVVGHVHRAGRAGDLTVVSVHWGSNWGYHVPREQVRFAHALVDGGVDLVHGHSSHHPRPLEVYRDRLILYGCGDFIDDYEGIRGYEEYRDDLRLAFLVSVEADSGRLAGLRMVPLRARRMRLEPASWADRAWLRATLDRISRGVGVTLEADGSLALV